MTSFTVKIESGNAAFADDPGPELQRILLKLLDGIGRGRIVPGDEESILDINGNKCGTVEWKEN